MPTKMTKSTTLKTILKRPDGQKILAKYHVPCLSCPMATMEIGSLKLDDVAKAYGVDANSMLAELNAKKPVKKKK